MTREVEHRAVLNDDDDQHTWCICGSEMEWVECVECGGEGEYDINAEDYQEDEPDYRACETCQGRGGYWRCWSQMGEEDSP